MLRRLLTAVIFFSFVLVQIFVLRQFVFAAPPANFQTTQIIGSGLSEPSGFEIAPDGRIFILERAGKIKIYKNGQLLATPFADLPSVASGDRGLIGIAFDPDFAANHYVYFYYTSADDLLNRIVRFDASGDVGGGGPFIIYQTTSPSLSLHVGGTLAFGPGGKLYFAVGDNGYPPNAQDLFNPHGKILRINKDGTIPSDNPFVGQGGKLGEIWAYGFRNPWRFQFDKANGRIFGGDVGEETIEEVNLIEKGKNYGWPQSEGPCGSCPYVNPIYSYPHNGESRAITGGPIYRGSMFPSQFQGSYFFGDYAGGFIKRLTLDAAGNSTGVSDFDLGAGSVVDMKVAGDGSMYYLVYSGTLFRISYSTTNQVPTASASADVTSGEPPLVVQFSSSGSSDPENAPLTYVWDFGDGTQSTEANPTNFYSKRGTYTIQLTVSDGVNFAQAAPITIQVGTPPSVSVGSPADGALYNAGDTISYSASAASGSGAPITSFTLDVVFHHLTHIHPFLSDLPGESGQFTALDTGEVSADTFYELKFIATDSDGLKTTKSVLINPRKSKFTLASSPTGLKLLLDGIPVTSPDVTEGVVGFRRELTAPVFQELSGEYFQFVSWSDGGAIRHQITTPSADSTYTANYQEAVPFSAEYFSNRTLSGTPAVARQDKIIDFVWNDGSPDPAITTDNFSARWTTRQFFPNGVFRFTTTADDGVRLYIDNQLVVDKWIDQPATAYIADIPLTAGDHDIKMEYYENSGGAIAKLKWEVTPRSAEPPPSPAPAGYQADYFDNMTLSGTPKISRTEQAVNFIWNDGSPDPAIPIDHFSARFTKVETLTSGNYEFTVTADDGVRLYVDGVLLIDKWIDQPSTTYKTTRNLADGSHNIVLEYFENAGGAVVALDFAKVDTQPPEPPPAQGYGASFWNVPGTSSSPQIPSTAPTLTRVDQQIDFDWGHLSPDGAISADHFVARWVAQKTFDAATYRFATISDDGIRVYVDDQLIIDQWNDHGSTKYEADVVMSAGDHNLKIEYYENGGGAVAKFNFAKTTQETGAFAADYFNNMTLSGTPTISRSEPQISFVWNDGSPDPAILPDHFSARFTKVETLTSGNYEFTTTADDGVRLFIDGVLVIDKWIDQPSTIYKATKALTDGNHTIVIEYFENAGGAVIIFAKNKL